VILAFLLRPCVGALVGRLVGLLATTGWQVAFTLRAPRRIALLDEQLPDDDLLARPGRMGLLAVPEQEELAVAKKAGEVGRALALLRCHSSANFTMRDGPFIGRSLRIAGLVARRGEKCYILQQPLDPTAPAPPRPARSLVVSVVSVAPRDQYLDVLSAFMLEVPERRDGLGVVRVAL